MAASERSCAAISFDRIADRYDETRGPTRSAAVPEIERWLIPGLVLEVGVGTGLIAGALRERGRPVFGVDLSPAMLAIAAGRLGPGRVAVGDARALPVATGSVSTVVAAHVLHVVGDIAGALLEAARVLRPGGRVVALHVGDGESDTTDVAQALEPMLAISRPRVVIGEAARRAGLAAGLSLVWQGPAAAVTIQHTPRQVVDGLRERAWSFLWDLDDDAWRRHVAPALTALAALPDQDRPREHDQRDQLTILART